MPTSSRTRPPSPAERDLLARLTERWGRRVAVKKDELDLDGHFDAGLPDFPGAMVPLLTLPGMPEPEPEGRARILSASWIAYNAKTTAIEDEIILPACRLMLLDHIPVRHDDVAVGALHQTIVDEHYHILMCHNAVGVTRRRRGLADLRFAPRDWTVVRALGRELAAVSGADRDLTRIAFALAAETTISSFLSGLSDAHGIQPMNRLTVDLHRRDESGHSVIFRELAASLYARLAPAERQRFEQTLLRGLDAFRAPDTAPWAAVAAAGECDVSAKDMADAFEGRPPALRDTGALQALFIELGLDPGLLTDEQRKEQPCAD